MSEAVNFFKKTPRYIDGELVENQWFVLGGWLVSMPDDECPCWELIYSNWRLLWGWEKGKFFGQALFNFWPYAIRWIP